MKNYLVIGNPIEHSLSPLLHNFWIKKYHISAIYKKMELERNNIAKIISNLRENKINGINVTVPFKKDVIPFLDEMSDIAKETNSVNTIYKKEAKVIGDNTDVYGFSTAIKLSNFEDFIHWLINLSSIFSSSIPIAMLFLIELSRSWISWGTYPICFCQELKKSKIELPKTLETKINSKKLKVGIAWSGNPKHARDYCRSIKLELIEDIFKNSNVDFYVLQKVYNKDDMKNIKIVKSTTIENGI